MQSAQTTTLLLSSNQANTCYLFCLLACCPQTACARSPAIIQRFLTAVNVCYFVFFLSFSFLSLSFLFFPFLFFPFPPFQICIGFGLPVAPASNAFCFLLLACSPRSTFLICPFIPIPRLSTVRRKEKKGNTLPSSRVTTRNSRCIIPFNFALSPHAFPPICRFNITTRGRKGGEVRPGNLRVTDCSFILSLLLRTN